MKAPLLIDWLTAIVYLGLLLAWVPAAWSISIFQAGSLIIASVAVAFRFFRDPIARPSWDVLLVAGLAVWGPLQIALGQSVYAYETWNASLQWLTCAVIYTVAKSALDNRDTRQRFLTVQLCAGTLLAVVSILFHFGSGNRIYGIFESRYPAYGPFVYKNHYAAFLELLIPLAFFRMTTARRARGAYAIVLAALVACAIASVSRAGVIVVFLELAVLVLITVIRKPMSIRGMLQFGLPVIGLMILFALIVGPDAIWNRFHEANPWQYRDQLAASTVDMIKARPAAGFGLGNWRAVYPQFATIDITLFVNEAHSDWLQWTSEGGIPFAAALLLFAGWMGWLAWKHPWGLGVPAVFLHCAVDYTLRLPALAAMVFLYAGALAATSRNNPEGQTDTEPGYRVLAVRTVPQA
jgi:O-antigen ligase